jgi:type I restriction enzyme S subunit
MMQHWKGAKLADIATINYGYTDSASALDIGPKFLRITDIQNNSVDWKTVPYCRCSKQDVSKYQLTDGDIVFARTGATTGKHYLLKDPPFAVFASYLIRLKINDQRQILPKYVSLFFQTKQYWDYISKGVSGSAQGGFNASKLGGLAIQIPPLPEQKRIVSIIEKAFAAIDKVKANAERNLENARHVFENYLATVFVGSAGWNENLLTELFTLNPPKKEARERLTDNDEVSFLPMEDLGINEKIVTSSKIKKLKEVILGYTYFSDGDLLLAKITPCFENGKIGIATDLKNQIGFGSSEYIVFRQKTSVLTEFLYYFIGREIFRDEGKKLMTGAVGHKRVSKDWIESYKIKYPDLGTQKSIISKANELKTKTNALCFIYQQKITALEELKKSLLDKAFKGEFTEKTKDRHLADL